MSIGHEESELLFPKLVTKPSVAKPFYDPQYQGWLIHSYGEVQQVLTDYTTFSSKRSNPRPSLPNDQNDPFYAGLVFMDPPQHKQLRAVIAQIFTSRRINDISQRIKFFVDILLDKVVDTGELDIIDDIASHLPVLIIAELLGLPTTDWEKFRHWTEKIFDAPRFVTQQALQEMREYFSVLIEQRRQSPNQDMISSLLSAEVNGKQLTALELIGNCILLLIAGSETIQNFIGNAMLCLSEYPGSMEQIYADHSLIPTALEEVLRYLPPTITIPRVATKDTMIGNQHIQSGQWVIPSLLHANRDETQFHDPIVFDIHRSPNRHLSFGHGTHFCLGSSLGRLEAKIVLETIFSRLRNLKRINTVPLIRIANVHSYGVKHLPFTFEKS